MRSTFSLATIIGNTRDTVRRFPFESAVAILGTTVTLVLVNGRDLDIVRDHTQTILNVIVTAPILMSLLLSISVAQERGSLQNHWATIGRLLSLIISGFIVSSLTYTDALAIEVTTLFLASHALVAVAPFHRGALSTWNFNRALFLRMCLALVFTGVLTSGVMLAVGSLNVFFEIRASSEVFSSILVVALGVYNTFFVLAGIPHVDEEKSADVPPSLRWLIQFVLIPLVGMFLIILYAYGCKVVFLSELRGEVAGYILAMGVASLLAWALAWPLRDNPEHRFVGFYVRWLGPVMIPMAALLTIAIAIRIAEYGVTPERFAVASLTAFFDIVILYLTIHRRSDLRILPLVLIIIGGITALGPLGSVAVTVRNQTARAESVLAANGIGAGERVDTIRFAQYPIEDRITWYSAVKSIREVDTTALHTYLSSHGLQFDTSSRVWHSLRIVGIQKPERPMPSAKEGDADNHWKFLVYQFDDDSVGLDIHHYKHQYFVKLTSKKPITIGKFTVAAVNDSSTFVIKDKREVIVDSLPLRQLIEGISTAEYPSIAGRTVKSTSGRRAFFLINGRGTVKDTHVEGLFMRGILFER